MSTVEYQPFLELPTKAILELLRASVHTAWFNYIAQLIKRGLAGCFDEPYTVYMIQLLIMYQVLYIKND